MKRREFAKLTGLSIIAVSTTGFIKFNGENYVGDCKTSSDILGPFYRPDSPVRNNLVIKDLPGEITELSGTVRHKNCTTGYKNAKIELWHCSYDQLYDNHSNDFKYRGTTYSDEKGNYKFTTQMPVPYDTGGGSYRPAHFHMMISTPDYPSLITQIYFTGDPYLESDPSTNNPRAEQRILNIDKRDGISRVIFDCNLSDEIKPTTAALENLIGKYQNVQNGNTNEFFCKDGELWVKNEVFGKVYKYVGENTFEYGGLPDNMYERLHFQLKQDNKLSLRKTAYYGEGEERVQNFIKI